MDLSNKTLYGKSLGSNQATFIADFFNDSPGGSSPRPFINTEPT